MIHAQTKLDDRTYIKYTIFLNKTSDWSFEKGQPPTNKKTEAVTIIDLSLPFTFAKLKLHLSLFLNWPGFYAPKKNALLKEFLPFCDWDMRSNLGVVQLALTGCWLRAWQLGGPLAWLATGWAWLGRPAEQAFFLILDMVERLTY